MTRCPSKSRERAPRRLAAASAGMAMIGALGAAWPAAAFTPQEQRGYDLVHLYCTGCHAVGRQGRSPLTEAPPFRTLHQRYPVEDLAESFAEGIMTGHPAMPAWQFDPGQIGDLIAYLKTLER